MPKIGSIGFIGAGKMGTALLEGVLQARLTGVREIFISEIDEDRRKTVCRKTGVQAVDSFELARLCKVIMICVKPQVVLPVLGEIRPATGKDKLVISIAGGISIEALEGALDPGVPVIRAMPNIAATVGQSATGFALGSAVKEKHVDIVRRIFGSVGLAVEVPEKLMGAVTGLSGSGPAYVFLFAEALITGALKAGLPHSEARKLAVQTIKGAAAMMEAWPEEHPASMRDQVTTPGGTTVAALHELEKRNFRDAVISAVEAAARRSLELGKG